MGNENTQIIKSIWKGSIGILLFLVTPELYASNCTPSWFAKILILDENSILKNTSSKIIKNVDYETCKILSFEYAKDKNFVYYKPTPNRDNYIIIVEKTDSSSFRLLNGSGKAQDKNNKYQFGKILKD